MPLLDVPNSSNFLIFFNVSETYTERYCEQLSGLNGIRLLEEPSECSSNFWLQTIVLDEPDEELRNLILTGLNDAGLMSRPAWKGLHKLEHFKECPKMDMLVVNSLEKKIINIPSSSLLCE